MTPPLWCGEVRPSNRGSLFFDVRIWGQRLDMQRYIRRALPQDRFAQRHALNAACIRYAGRGIRGGRIGTLCFHMGDLSVWVRSHEIFHALVHWGFLRGKMDRERHEESLALANGEMNDQLLRQIQECGVADASHRGWWHG